MAPTELSSIAGRTTGPDSPTLLPPPFTNTEPPPTIIAQGAEAMLFRTHFLSPDLPCALKYRPAKPWRHPTLDVRLTRHRILSEARILLKCKREGVNVPAVWSVDWEGAKVEGLKGERSGGWMIMEWIEGETVRTALNGWLELQGVSGSGLDPHANRKLFNEGAIELMGKIGTVVGKMHSIGVVHGDLTTSNLMLSPPQDPDPGGSKYSLKGNVAVIDFGLAAQSVQDEDKAVDLYVLERAFGSTHPTVDFLFEEILKAYGKSYKKANVVLKKLEEVRMRGRKRSMLG